MLNQLRASVDGKEVAAAAAALIDLGRGDDGIFALRREELHQIFLGESSMEANRTLAIKLGDEVAELVTAARAESDAAASRSAEAINTGKIFMIIMTVRQPHRRGARDALLRRATDYPAAGEHNRRHGRSRGRGHLGRLFRVANAVTSLVGWRRRSACFVTRH